jgi:hypothetical protein
VKFVILKAPPPAMTMTRSQKNKLKQKMTLMKAHKKLPQKMTLVKAHKKLPQKQKMKKLFEI